MHAVIGRVEIKPDRADETLAMIGERGVAMLQGEEGPFWGHNAIVRVHAFAESCGLPQLSGKPPFGIVKLRTNTLSPPKRISQKCICMELVLRGM